MAYKVSVIVEVIKNKKKLKQTIKSLKAQTLNFKEDIQVIFLADDKVKEDYVQFCEEYAEVLGKHAVFMRKPDFSQIEGAWINCLQEGQEWTPTVFEKVVQTTEETVDDIDFVLEKYKEATERTVLEKRYEFVLNEMEKFQDEFGKYIFSRKFDKELETILQTNEKLEVMYGLTVILTKAEQMVILQREQLVGKRKYEKKEKDWYFTKLPAFRERMQQLKIPLSKGRKEQVDLAFMTKLSESMKDKVENLLTDEEIKEYERWLKESLDELDDAVINRATMNASTRRYAFSLKTGKDMAGEVVCRNGIFYYDNLMFYNIRSSDSFMVQADEEDEHRIIGTSYHPLQEEQMRFYLTDGVGEYPFVYIEDGQKVYKCLKHVVRKERRYECILPAEIKSAALHLECIYMGRYVTCLEG